MIATASEPAVQKNQSKPRAPVTMILALALPCLFASCTRSPLPYGKNLVDNPGFEDRREVFGVAHATPPDPIVIKSGAPGWGSYNQRPARSRDTWFTVTSLTDSDKKVFESGEHMLLVSASESPGGVVNHLSVPRTGQEIPDGITKAGVKLCILRGSVRMVMHGRHGHAVSRTIRAVDTVDLQPFETPKHRWKHTWKPDFQRFYLTYDHPGDPVQSFSLVAAEDNTAFLAENASLVVKPRPAAAKTVLTAAK